MKIFTEFRKNVFTGLGGSCILWSEEVTIVTMQEKLFALMADKNITAAALARETGIPNSSLADILKGKTEKIAIAKIFPLAKYFDCSVDYLVLNEITDPRHGKTSGFQVGYDEMIHIQKYRALHPLSRNVVDTTVKALEIMEAAKTQTQAKEDTSDAERAKLYAVELPETVQDMDEVRVYDQPAAAGTGNYLDEYVQYEVIAFPRKDVPYRTDFGVRVSGDSMEPHYKNGDIVFVENTPEIRDGEIGVVILNGNSYIKELGVDYDTNEVFLISINNKYDPIQVHEYDDINTVGRVVGVWSGDEE